MGTSKLSGTPGEMLGVTSDGLASHPGGVAIFLVTSCYRNRDKLRQYRPHPWLICRLNPFLHMHQHSHKPTIQVQKRFELSVAGVIKGKITSIKKMNP